MWLPNKRQSHLQLNLCQVPALGLFHPSQVPLVLPGGLPPRVGQREVEQRHLRLAVLGLCVLVRLRGLFCFWGNLGGKVTFILDLGSGRYLKHDGQPAIQGDRASSRPSEQSCRHRQPRPRRL